MLKTIDMPWRKVYEMYSAVSWGLAGIVMLGASILSNMPFTVLGMFVLFAFSMALYRGRQTLTLWDRQAALVGRSVLWTSADDIYAKAKKQPGRLFLGYGFDWKQVHVQHAYEVRRRDVSTLLPPKFFMKLREQTGGDSGASLRGAEWIHGLEPVEKELSMPIQDLDGHCLILGTTRSGKSRFFEMLITQFIARDEVVIVVDPKGDRGLSQRCQRECIRAGREDAFMFFHPAFPAQSIRVDPLKNWNRPTEIASRIAALIPSETGDDAFKSFSWRAINIVAQGLIEVDTRPTLVNLRRYIEGGVDDLILRAIKSYLKRTAPDWESRAQPYINSATRGGANRRRPSADAASETIGLIEFYEKELDEKQHSTVIDGLINIYRHESAHFSKMITSLVPVLESLTSGDLRSLLSPDPTDPTDPRPILDTAKIIESRKVVYIGLDSLSDSTVGSAIGSILLADLTSVAGHIYNFSGDKVRVNIFIDESSEVVSASSFVSLLNKSAGSGFRVLFAAQTIPDFSAKTGSEDTARQMLGNANNLVAFRTKDRGTQDFIVESLGKTTVQTITTSQSTNAIKGEDVTRFDGSYGERLSEVETDVFAPELLGQMPDLQFIASISGGRLVKGRIPLVTMDNPPRLEDQFWFRQKQ